MNMPNEWKVRFEPYDEVSQACVQAWAAERMVELIKTIQTDPEYMSETMRFAFAYFACELYWAGILEDEFFYDCIRLIVPRFFEEDFQIYFEVGRRIHLQRAKKKEGEEKKHVRRAVDQGRL